MLTFNEWLRENTVPFAMLPDGVRQNILSLVQRIKAGEDSATVLKNIPPNMARHVMDMISSKKNEAMNLVDLHKSPFHHGASPLRVRNVSGLGDEKLDLLFRQVKDAFNKVNLEETGKVEKIATVEVPDDVSDEEAKSVFDALVNKYPVAELHVHLAPGKFHIYNR